MVTFARTCSTLLLVLFSLSACATHEPEVVLPLPAEPEAFAAGLADFESAYNELNSAIDATPEWETRPKFAAQVRGLSELAEYRAEGLRRFVLQDLISDAGIDLMKAQARERAMVDSTALPLAGGTFLEDSASQLDAMDGESAFHRVSEKLDMLDAFSKAKRSTSWLDAHVISQARRDLERVVSTELDEAQSWSRLELSPEDFIQGQAQAQIILDRLNWDDIIAPAN